MILSWNTFPELETSVLVEENKYIEYKDWNMEKLFTLYQYKNDLSFADKKDFDTYYRKLNQTIVAFANAEGGYIFFGISDDLKIKGIKNENNPQDKLSQILIDICGKMLPVKPKLDIYKFPIKFSSKIILRLQVMPIDEFSAFIHSEFGYFIRQLSSNCVLNTIEVDIRIKKINDKSNKVNLEKYQEEYNSIKNSNTRLRDINNYLLNLVKNKSFTDLQINRNSPINYVNYFCGDFFDEVPQFDISESILDKSKINEVYINNPINETEESNIKIEESVEIIKDEIKIDCKKPLFYVEHIWCTKCNIAKKKENGKLCNQCEIIWCIKCNINKKKKNGKLCNQCYALCGNKKLAIDCEHTNKNAYAKNKCKQCYNKSIK